MKHGTALPSYSQQLCTDSTMNSFTIFLFFGCVTMSKYFVSGDFTTDQKFGEQKYGDKTVRNNIWGPGAGPQSLKAIDGSNWCVDASHGSTGGIKSYPHSEFVVKKPLSAVTVLTSTFGAKVTPKPGTLAYAFTYDIWLQNKKFEIMIWLDYHGSVGPLGAMYQNNVNKGGYTWKVHKGTNGVNAVYSFLNVGKMVTSGTINLKEILDWINEQKWFPAGPATLVEEIQLGFEITSTPTNTTFCLNAFTVNSK